MAINWQPVFALLAWGILYPFSGQGLAADFTKKELISRYAKPDERLLHVLMADVRKEFAERLLEKWRDMARKGPSRIRYRHLRVEGASVLFSLHDEADKDRAEQILKGMADQHVRYKVKEGEFELTFVEAFLTKQAINEARKMVGWSAHEMDCFFKMSNGRFRPRQVHVPGTNHVLQFINKDAGPINSTACYHLPVRERMIILVGGSDKQTVLQPNDVLDGALIPHTDGEYSLILSLHPMMRDIAFGETVLLIRQKKEIGRAVVINHDPGRKLVLHLRSLPLKPESFLIDMLGPGNAVLNEVNFDDGGKQ